MNLKVKMKSLQSAFHFCSQWHSVLSHQIYILGWLLVTAYQLLFGRGICHLLWWLFFNTVEAKVIILTWYVKLNETLAINKFQRSRPPHPYMVKNPLNTLFSETKGQWPWDLVCSIEAVVSTRFAQTMNPFWPWPTLWQGQIWFLCIYIGKILKCSFFLLLLKPKS